MAGSGRRKVTADCLQSSTQALQCQHSSGYFTSGGVHFPAALKTSVGQISAHVPQALHFSFAIMGGINNPPDKESFLQRITSHVAPRGHSPLHHSFTPEWGDIPAKRWHIHSFLQKPGWPFAAGGNIPSLIFHAWS